ncbi:MAG: RNA polymerase sigma-70 factor [Chloroflexota bacterium]
MTDMNFDDYQSRLFGIAYGMLGTVMDAEDVLQDAWVRYQKLEAPIQHPYAYLRKIVTNLSLDRLKSAKVQREQYIGEWLPEPVLTSDDNPAKLLQRSESISMALLVVLENLSPLERAVFILREVFDYEYAEIARTLERSESACRKLFSRAKEHVQRARPRFDVPQELHDRLVSQFFEATRHGNMQEMVNFLAEDTVLYSDGGGVVSAATRPLYGRDTIIAFFSGLYAKTHRDGVNFTFEQSQLNGQTGLLMRDSTGEIILVATFEASLTHITVIRLILNPAKLSGLV